MGCYSRAVCSVEHRSAVLLGGKFTLLQKHEACTCNPTCAGSWGCVLLNLHTRPAKLQEGPKIQVIVIHGRTNHPVLSAFKSTSISGHSRTSLELILSQSVADSANYFEFSDAANSLVGTQLIQSHLLLNTGINSKFSCLGLS